MTLLPHRILIINSLGGVYYLAVLEHQEADRLIRNMNGFQLDGRRLRVYCFPSTFSLMFILAPEG